MEKYAIKSTDFEIELLKKLNYWDDLKHNYLKQFKKMPGFGQDVIRRKK